jgi:hypothetical protein
MISIAGSLAIPSAAASSGDDDAYVVHPFEPHVSNLQDVV